MYSPQTGQCGICTSLFVLKTKKERIAKIVPFKQRERVVKLFVGFCGYLPEKRLFSYAQSKLFYDVASLEVWSGFRHTIKRYQHP